MLMQRCEWQCCMQMEKLEMLSLDVNGDTGHAGVRYMLALDVKGDAGKCWFPTIML